MRQPLEENDITKGVGDPTGTNGGDGVTSLNRSRERLTTMGFGL